MQYQKQVVIIDFDDSFTFNIASELYLLGLNAKVIHYNLLPSLVLDSEVGIVILGPGPGHPDDYSFYYPYLKQIINNTNIFVMGICLGHQLIWKLKGASIFRLKQPLHGHSCIMQIPAWSKYFDHLVINKKVLVQSYNSLAVLYDADLMPVSSNVIHGSQVMASLFFNGISFQFHPESIGTSYPRIFFGPLKKKLYNEY